MTLRYLLDTNMCIYIAKQQPLSVLRKFETLHIGSVVMSTISYGELLYGAQKSQYSQQALLILEELIKFIPLLPLPAVVAQHYGNMCAQLEKQGELMCNNDLWIASQAIAMELTLVTNNVREFSRIPGLKLENWVND